MGYLGKICYYDIDIIDGYQEFKYSVTIGPYWECGDYIVKNPACIKYNPIPPPPGPCWDTITVNINVPCEEAPGTGTPGYRKNHPEAWPVDEITVGGVIYSKEDAINEMKKPVKKNKSYTMFPALVSAMLNVAIGNDSSCILDIIGEADDWMASNHLGSGVSGDSLAWKVGEPLYWALDDYNNGYLCALSRDQYE